MTGQPLSPTVAGSVTTPEDQFKHCLHLTLTDKQDKWVKAQIGSGDYTNDSEYFRDLVRRDQEQNAKLKALKEAIQEGLDSGVGDRTVGDIWAEAEARHQRKNA